MYAKSFIKTILALSLLAAISHTAFSSPYYIGTDRFRSPEHRYTHVIIPSDFTAISNSHYYWNRIHVENLYTLNHRVHAAHLLFSF